MLRQIGRLAKVRRTAVDRPAMLTLFSSKESLTPRALVRPARRPLNKLQANVIPPLAARAKVVPACRPKLKFVTTAMVVARVGHGLECRLS